MTTSILITILPNVSCR